MENNTFKGSFFGGFNRQDVMNYIEKASRESDELLRANQEQLHAMEEELNRMRGDLEQLQAALDDASAARDAAQSELKEVSGVNAGLKEALERAQAQNRRDAEELQSLRATAAALQPEVDEYHQLKNNIAEVELDARHRADAIRSKAKTEAETLLNKAREEAKTLQAAAAAKAEKTISDANANADVIRQRADQHMVLTRQQIKALLTSCQSQYEQIMEGYKTAALQAATSLQKAQENMTHLPAVFEKISDGIARLSDGAQKKD